MKLLKTIEIPLFIQHIKLSNKRRAKYYLKNSKVKIPKKYAKFKFSKATRRLIHPNGEPVIANSRSVGTPRFKKINGQEIYSGMPHHMRSKLVKQIKSSFQTVLSKHAPILEFPIQVEMEVHTIIGRGDWDLDNMWIYNKCFQDALSDAGIIPDDNIQYITKPASPELVPVANEEDRKFVFKLYKDDREIIKQNPYFQNLSQENW